MLKEFKEFAMRGNVVDLAVGVIIGGAFGKIVDSLVKDVIMPPIGYVLGNVDFSNLFILLKEGTKAAGPYESLKGRAGCRCSDHQPGRLLQRSHQLHHRRLCCLPADTHPQ